MPKPVNIKDVEWSEWKHNDEIRIRFKPLHDGPKAHMGVCIQELPPGCRTSPAHYHMKEEEHLYVLKGEMTVRLGNKKFSLSPGDYICFASGDPKEHCLSNPNSLPCEYLMWGEKNPDEVIIYPDSNKVSVRSLGELYRREPLDYWEDES